jgi:ABC-type uncharacterized transport system permease subunit
MDLQLINDLLAASIRIATPITLAALGGILCQKSGVFNIGLEGFMLIGAFAAICGVRISGGSIWIGMCCAVVTGILMSLVFALAILKFKADQIIAGIAVNLLGVGLTSFLMRAVFGVTGSLKADVINKIPMIKIPILENIPVVGAFFGSQHVLTYISYAMVVVTFLILNKTHYGLSICTVGELPEAAATAGIRPNKIYFWTIIWSGALCGLAGSYLSCVSVSEFTENMVQGRGFTAFTAIIFGGANPVATWLASILFGFADAIGIRLELLGTGISSSIVKMFPYILSIIVLALSCIVRIQKLQKLDKRAKKEIQERKSTI